MREERPEIRVLAPWESHAALRQQFNRRRLLQAGAFGAFATFVAACGGSTGDSGGGGGEETTAASTGEIEEGNLLLANWVDYSDPKSYEQYTAEFGPKVVVDGYGSNEELLAKLGAGGSKFDVVSPTGYAVAQMIAQGLAVELNRDLIPNIGNIEDAFTKSDYDPGNKYSVPKDYGITSWYWRTDIVSEKPTTIKEGFDLLPKYSKQKVNFLEGGSQNVAMALAALDADINTEDEALLEQAKKVLLDARPHISTINSTFIERATQGDIHFGIGWSADIRRVIETRKEKGDEPVEFLIPEGTTEFWVDNWVIPTASEHPIAAHAWINFMLDPKVAGQEMSYHQYATPVKGITEFIEPELAKDPIVFPSQEALDRYQSIVLTPTGQKQRDRIYTEFKAA